MHSVCPDFVGEFEGTGAAGVFEGDFEGEDVAEGFDELRVLVLDDGFGGGVGVVGVFGSRGWRGVVGVGEFVFDLGCVDGSVVVKVYSLQFVMAILHIADIKVSIEDSSGVEIRLIFHNILKELLRLGKDLSPAC